MTHEREPNTTTDAGIPAASDEYADLVEPPDRAEPHAA